MSVITLFKLNATHFKTNLSILYPVMDMQILQRKIKINFLVKIFTNYL